MIGNRPLALVSLRAAGFHPSLLAVALTPAGRPAGVQVGRPSPLRGRAHQPSGGAESAVRAAATRHALWTTAEEALRDAQAAYLFRATTRGHERAAAHRHRAGAYWVSLRASTRCFLFRALEDESMTRYVALASAFSSLLPGPTCISGPMKTAMSTTRTSRLPADVKKSETIKQLNSAPASARPLLPPTLPRSRRPRPTRIWSSASGVWRLPKPRRKPRRTPKRQRKRNAIASVPPPRWPCSSAGGRVTRPGPNGEQIYMSDQEIANRGRSTPERQPTAGANERLSPRGNARAKRAAGVAPPSGLL